MLSQPEHLQEFKKLLSPWKAVYHYADVSTISIKKPDGIVLLFGRIILETTQPIRQPQAFRLETDHLSARREVISLQPGSIDSVIDEASHGAVSLRSERLALKPVSQYLSSTVFPVYHPAIIFGPRLPTLVIGGISRHQVLSHPSLQSLEYLDWSLKASDQPFASLDDLLLELGLPTQSQMGDSTAFEMVARSPVALLDSSTIVNGQAIVKCQIARDLDKGKLKIGYKVLHKERTERSFLTGDAFDWKEEGGFLSGSLKIPTGAAPYLQAFLSYDGTTLQEGFLADPSKTPNYRHAVYTTFDKGLEVLREFLAGLGKNKQDDFESGVALLLHLVGFVVGHLGVTRRLDEGPDLIASTPLGKVAVIECTIGQLNEKNKLAKLIRRTALVKESLAKSGYPGAQVQPVLVTPLPRSGVQVELQEAGRNGVAVVCKEDLESSLTQATLLLPNPEEVYTRLAGLVPEVPREPESGTLFQ